MISIVDNRDCFDGMAEMEDNEFDLAIVDPPYGLGSVLTGFSKHKKMKWNNAPPTKEYFEELHRVSKNQIIWGVNYFSPHILMPGRVVFDKRRDLIGKGGVVKWSDCDLASQSFNNRIEKFSYRWNGNVQGDRINWYNDGPDARIHPTQKPIILYKWLLKNYAKQGDKILDTHVGSGSSRIACYEMGFDFEGYEIDAGYWEAQEKRFKIVKDQLSIF